MIMERPTTPAAADTRSALSALAAFSAGVLLGVRPSAPSRTRTLVTVSAAALAGLSLIKPSGAAVRKAGTRRRAGQVRFSLVIPRPVEQVFALCADFENFPHFIASLKRVIDYGDGRSHWSASTPGGGTVEWNTVTTKFVTNSVIGWRSAPGAEVQMNGLLRFMPDGDGTCVRIAIEYEVKSSSLRDAIAALLSPRNGERLEREIRALGRRVAGAPRALAKELPPVMTAERDVSA
jgi:uncharacterized membrane protein